MSSQRKLKIAAIEALQQNAWDQWCPDRYKPFDAGQSFTRRARGESLHIVSTRYIDAAGVIADWAVQHHLGTSRANYLVKVGITDLLYSDEPTAFPDFLVRIEHGKADASFLRWLIRYFIAQTDPLSTAPRCNVEIKPAVHGRNKAPINGYRYILKFSEKPA